MVCLVSGFLVGVICVKKTTQLRKLLEKGMKGELIVIPEANDVMMARNVEANGFKAVYMTGYGLTVNFFGIPSTRLLTLSERAYQACRYAYAVDIPIIADGDIGYGNYISIKLAVQEFETSGVAAIQIDDKEFYPTHDALSGSDLIGAGIMVEKIQTAVAARRDKDFVIVACTYAKPSLGVEEVIKRVNLYQKAGADVLAIGCEESIKKLGCLLDFKLPVMALVLGKSRNLSLTVEELQLQGYCLAVVDVNKKH